jgi:hypothetical protein
MPSSLPPPPGGFGAPTERSARVVALAAHAPAKRVSGWRVAFWIAVSLAVVVVVGAVWLRRDISNARTYEARTSLARIGALALAAHARDGRVCGSASARVPVRMPAECSGPMTGIYSSSQSDWTVDQTEHAGFACLGFEYSAPQYYQYEYTATDDGFVARARTCVPEAAREGAFEVRGHVQGGRLVVGDVSKIPNE